MYKELKIEPPFFEIGPKAYFYGEEMLKLAKAADAISIRYDVRIIIIIWIIVSWKLLYL